MEQISQDDQKQLSEIIGLIYDSAQSPELWPKLLGVLDSTLGLPITLQEGQGNSVVSGHKTKIQILKPHFQRAIEFNHRFNSLESERNAVADVLDRLPIGIILADEKCTITAMNRHAKNILNENDALSTENNQLVLHSQTDTKKLHQAVSEVSGAQLSNQNLPQYKSMMVGSTSDSPCSIHITASNTASLPTDKSLVSIYISCAESRQEISANILAETYTLTPAETRLLKHLLNGSHSLSAVASKISVSKHTVRSQLKSILEKTNTHSQTELIKLVLTGPAALIGESAFTAPQNSPLNPEDNLSKQAEETSPLKGIRLMDGRWMEYTEFGDKNGTPLLHFHGWLHSKDKLHPHSNFAETYGLRVIVPERPGHGCSDPQKKHSLKNYCENDIQQLASHLGLDRFYVTGDGEGGPYALACAATLSERVIRAATTGCMPDPRFEHLENLLPFDRRLQILARSTPKSILHPFSKLILKALKKNNSYFELMASDFYISDQAVVSSDEHKQIFKDSMNNITPKNIDGIIDDYYLRLKDWDFKPEDIKTEVHIWHGIHDCFSNIESAKDIASAIPNCEPHFLQGHGHYVFITHWDEILHALVNG